MYVSIMYVCNYVCRPVYIVGVDEINYYDMLSLCT